MNYYWFQVKNNNSIYKIYTFNVTKNEYESKIELEDVNESYNAIMRYENV